MAMFEWSKSLETGLETIDTHHKVIVGYINRIHDGVEAGQAPATLAIVLSGLIGYTTTHFKYEETLFEKTNYPHIKDHEIYHKTLIDKITHFQQKLNSEDETINTELMEFLKSWLVNHILKEDMKYVPHFHQKKIH